MQIERVNEHIFNGLTDISHLSRNAVTNIHQLSIQSRPYRKRLRFKFYIVKCTLSINQKVQAYPAHLFINFQSLYVLQIYSTSVVQHVGYVRQNFQKSNTYRLQQTNTDVTKAPTVTA